VILLGPYLIGCALLAVAGAAKAARPGDTARALHELVPAVALVPATVAVRAGAIVECALGVAALALPRPPLAGAVALSYLVFAGFVLLARRRGGPLATCGCFGAPDTPPTILHVVVNLGITVSAVAVAAHGFGGTLGDVLAQQPWHGVPLVVVSGLGAWLAFLTLVPLARLQAARQLLGGRPTP
jgi:hypothetical protein